MRQTAYSWITVHLARLKRSFPTEGSFFSGPSTAATWRCGYDAPLGEDGWQVERTEIWGGIAFYPNRVEAEAALYAEQQQLPFAGQTIESWHGLLAVVAQGGEVDWSHPGERRPFLQPLDRDPGGLLAVITSAGYFSEEESEYPRILAFLKQEEAVRVAFSASQSNLVRQLFSLVGTPDGMTFSVWRSGAEMLAAAYGAGMHRKAIDRHRAAPMFDRSAITRLRLLAGRGTWNGIDPLAARGS